DFSVCQLTRPFMARSISARVFVWRWRRVSITVVETKITALAMAVTGNAICRYAVVILGCRPCDSATIISHRMPISRLIAKVSNVSRNVTTRTRAGIAYQRAWALEVLRGDII